MHNVVIPWRDRASYLRITLATLNEAARGRTDVCVHIFNDSSNDVLPDIVSECFFEVYEHELPSTDCHYNYVNMLGDFFENVLSDYVVTQDSDACIHPDYFNVIDNILQDLDDFGHVSLFNEDCHPEPTRVHKDIYHVRNHISFFSTVVGRRAWDAFPKPTLGHPIPHGCMDGHFSTYVKNNTPFEVYSTINSYAEHIGQKGQHVAKQGDKDIISRARRFYP
jgi:hypothetical protein